MRLDVPQGVIVALNPAHHKSAFERGHDQCRHRLRIHSGTRVALFLSLLHEGLHAAHPGSKRFCYARPKDGLPSSASMAVFRIGHPPGIGDLCSTKFAMSCLSLSMPFAFSSTCKSLAFQAASHV